ncbi:methyltransferase family protein [Actinoplanes regularis]|uniref:Protein-S-isoprenylcysteine O-methyltransferase Ste14 n=1 Tax=Actinoplanes regularis TaxID=52697 RepID=A0A239FND5_9ACTN|nr:isoprenylcysteine carboxylmethyltransferase family protein [Actinoplanes regularis]GIE89695.1 protein-S-isoprenylcysteine methyltransferase [Actinoplanes regularis]SNS58399.1 Protein-S-isoprenylcysteine O-methyltransferase Ste14 [Actinoplanes regularis]
MNQRVVVAGLRALLPTTVALFVVAIVAHAAQANRPPHLVAALLCGVYLLWILVEARITVRHPAQESAENNTLLPYALTRAGVGVSAALWPLRWDRLSVWMAVPIALFIGAVTLRLVAIRTLGRFYSHHVVRYSDHSIVTTGPYRLVRHPAYTGMLLANAGFVAFFVNPLSAVLLVALCAVVIWRIGVEERVLLDVPGYGTYSRGRARLLPGVW